MTSCTDMVLASRRGASGVGVDDPDRIAGELHTATCLADDLETKLVFSLNGYLGRAVAVLASHGITSNH